MDAGHFGLFPYTLNKSKPKDLLNSAPLWLCGVNKVQPTPLELKCALEFLWTKKVDGIDVGDGFQDERWRGGCVQKHGHGYFFRAAGEQPGRWTFSRSFDFMVKVLLLGCVGLVPSGTFFVRYSLESMQLRNISSRLVQQTGTFRQVLWKISVLTVCTRIMGSIGPNSLMSTIVRTFFQLYKGCMCVYWMQLKRSPAYLRYLHIQKYYPRSSAQWLFWKKLFYGWLECSCIVDNFNTQLMCTYTPTCDSFSKPFRIRWSSSIDMQGGKTLSHFTKLSVQHVFEDGTHYSIQ